MTDKELLSLAEAAALNSYAPYSHFHVGAALLTADGRVFTGCNIENTSYSLTVCAERTAVFKAVSEGCDSFAAIAIVGSSDGDFSAPCPPCGACLQVLAEFCTGELRIILADGAHTLAELMPMAFKL